MYVAKKKRKESIVEYILYMMQVLDTIRVFDLNKRHIEDKLLPEYNLSQKEIQEVKEWYFGLIEQMKEEGKYNNGMVQSIQNTINEVNELHLWLLNSDDYSNYKKIFENVMSYLIEFKLKTKEDSINDIDLAIKLVYSFVLLKMKNKAISNETENAVKEVSVFLNKLSKYFVEYENGNISVV